MRIGFAVRCVNECLRTLYAIRIRVRIRFKEDVGGSGSGPA
jgi:hypothetical protein